MSEIAPQVFSLALGLFDNKVIASPTKALSKDSLYYLGLMSSDLAEAGIENMTGKSGASAEKQISFLAETIERTIEMVRSGNFDILLKECSEEEEEEKISIERAKRELGNITTYYINFIQGFIEGRSNHLDGFYVVGNHGKLFISDQCSNAAGTNVYATIAEAIDIYGGKKQWREATKEELWEEIGCRYFGGPDDPEWVFARGFLNNDYYEADPYYRATDYLVMNFAN